MEERIWKTIEYTITPKIGGKTRRSLFKISFINIIKKKILTDPSVWYDEFHGLRNVDAAKIYYQVATNHNGTKIYVKYIRNETK